MKIVAILQNQWFKNAEKARQIYAKHPGKRNELIARYLFAGCKTGKVLRRVFGPELCGSIVWEEASPEFGEFSSSVFKANPRHIQAFIEREKPDVVLGFGNVACNGVLAALGLFRGERMEFQFIGGPHPAARGADTEARLMDIAKRLREAREGVGEVVTLLGMVGDGGG